MSNYECPGCKEIACVCLGEVHDLKCWTLFFKALEDGSKTFEVRKADRNYQVGDVLRIKEFIPCKPCGGYGREWDNGDKTDCGSCLGKKGVYAKTAPLSFKITYVMRGGFLGVSVGFVILGILRLKA